MGKHSEEIEILKDMLKDAKKNRKDDDFEEQDDRWRGYIEGIEGAIYRLEMNSA